MKNLTQNEVEKRLKHKKLKLLSKYKNYDTKIKIKCFCGGIFTSTFQLIKKEKVKSCGCLNLKRGENNFHWKGYKEISGTYFSVIKKHSEMKNRKFNITAEYLWKLFLKQNKKCALSGVDISFSRPSKQSRQTASLDRINSSKGYIIGNVQWVHKRINLMKRNDSDEDFYKWIRIIHNYQEKNNVR